MRPGLRPKRRARGSPRRCAVECDGPRRPQRLRARRTCRMSWIDEAIERYAEEHSTPAPALFERLAEETRATQNAPQMMVGQLEGAFLSFVVGLTQPRLVLEIGTFTGWSSIAMASALPTGGRIVTCDVNEETSAIARRYAEEAGVADRIEYRLGPAIETVATLDGPFDLVFIDADKEGYVDYYEAVLPKLAEHGVILADNTLANGDVLDPNGPMSEAIAHFNDHVRADHHVGLCERLLVRRIAPVRKHHDAHAGGLRGADSAVRVLDRGAAPGRNTELSC